MLITHFEVIVLFLSFKSCYNAILQIAYLLQGQRNYSFEYLSLNSKSPLASQSTRTIDNQTQ